MKDFWGNDAIDFGMPTEMQSKYADRYIVMSQNKPFNPGYVLALYEDEQIAEDVSSAFEIESKKNGMIIGVIGVLWGHDISAKKQEGFVGGFGL